MATYIIKIDESNKAAKGFLELIKNLPFIEIVEGKPKKKLQYNPKFVQKIKKAQKEIERGEFTEIDTNDIWKGLGL